MGKDLSYLLNLVLCNIVQRAVRLQTDSHSAFWEFRCAFIWLQLSG